MPVSPLLVILALVTIQVLFGLNYVISKVVVDAFPPLLWASVRIIIASAVMIAVAVFSRKPPPSDGKRFFIPLIGFALLGMIINQAAFLTGLHYTTAVNSSILNTSIPIFTLLVVTFRGQEQLNFRRFLGFLFSFSGVLVLLKVENFTLSSRTAVGDLLTLLNCLSFAFFLSYSKKFLEAHDRVWTTAWLFIYGSIGLTVLALPDWIRFEWPVMTPLLWACASFAVIGGTLLPYFLNNWSLAHARSSQVALFVYIQPVVASLLAWGWFGQVPTPRTVFASLFIFTGVVLALGRDRVSVPIRTQMVK